MCVVLSLGLTVMCVVLSLGPARAVMCVVLSLGLAGMCVDASLGLAEVAAPAGRKKKLIVNVNRLNTGILCGLLRRMALGTFVMPDTCTRYCAATQRRRARPHIVMLRCWALRPCWGCGSVLCVASKDE
eukprot:6240361-Amphidinium_carterae.1